MDKRLHDYGLFKVIKDVPTHKKGNTLDQIHTNGYVIEAETKVSNQNMIICVFKLKLNSDNKLLKHPKIKLTSVHKI